MVVQRLLAQARTFVDYRLWEGFLRAHSLHPPGLNGLAPWVEPLAGAGGAAATVLAGLAALLVWQKAVPQRLWLVLGGGLVWLAWGPLLGAESWGHGAGLALFSLLELVVWLLLLAYVVRGNLPAYFFALWSGPLIAGGLQLVALAPPYAVAGYAMVALACLPVVGLLVGRRRGGAETAQ